MNLKRTLKILDNKNPVEGLTYEDLLHRIKTEGTFSIGDFSISLQDDGDYVRLEIVQKPKSFVFTSKDPGREKGSELPDLLFPTKTEFKNIFGNES